jgi:aminomethyltransferase
MDKKTPLYEEHLALNGKVVPFAGYLLPIEYQTGMIKEHLAVRNDCGLFDVSHMGEIVLKGPGALDSINHIMANSYTSLATGKIRYTPMCNENGGVVDDLIIYHIDDDVYLLVVNAANCEKDDAHIRTNLLADTEMTNISEQVAQLALQGPKSTQILQKVMQGESIPAKYYTFQKDVTICGVKCLISQTGYTGEVGYELYCAPQDAVTLWNGLLEAGKEDGLIPCGLGARDTLRLEAAMPLYGHEMDDTVSPLETNLDFGVKMNKPEFIGKTAIEAQGTPKRMRIGLKTTGRGIIREHQDIYLGDTKIGVTTSGTHCAYLGGSYAMALVENGCVSVGDTVEADVRGRRVSAEVVPLPFYKHS